MHALAKRSIKDWSCDGMCASTAASSANSMSLKIVFLLSSLLSNVRGWTVCRQLVHVYIQKHVREAVLGYTTLLHSIWKKIKMFRHIPIIEYYYEDSIRLFSGYIFMKNLTRLLIIVGHPILVLILNKPLLLTGSNAFVRSMHEMYNGIFWSLHFSCCWRTEKSYQLMVDLNKIHTVIPEIIFLQVIKVKQL